MSLRKPPGTSCRLFYDCELSQGVAAGHYMVTPGGSGYRITNLHAVKRKTPMSEGWQRLSLQCLRCKAQDIPPEATRHELVWYSRNPNAKNTPEQ